MILEMDNRGSIDLANSWSIGGRTRHVGCKLNWLRELKEEGIMEYRWVSGNDNDRGNLIKIKFYPIYTKIGGHLENDDSNHQSNLKNKKNHQNGTFTGYNFLPSWFMVGKWPVRH